MALRDLAAFLEDDGLDYPLPASAFGDPTRFPDGKTYKVPSPDARTGLWLSGLFDIGAKAAAGTKVSADDLSAVRLDDNEERSLYRRVLGSAYDEMLVDGVKWTTLQRIGQDAYLCFAASTDLADAALTSLGKAPVNRTQRRGAKKAAGSRSRRASTATATPTRRRGSTGSSTSPSEPGAASTG